MIFSMRRAARSRTLTKRPSEKFRTIEETLHLLRSLRNAARLLKSISRANAVLLKR